MSNVNKLFKQELKVINIGLESFYNDLKKQEVSAIHVNWRPAAGGNKKLASLLSKLK
ncbi:fdrA domain protein [Proteiniborus sp. MB09-C3]|uniref:fdrA domain protein n=1 Tax=Proteiniborus sp. MB09-C3 TaxID=3050072 RepID=UPI00255764DA|nr:fdrA domain protein [Proteiniborus sp. MB09-C3]WIV11678.1 fdrA domain protein [Proteiniborus sp. MB09-C3]